MTTFAPALCNVLATTAPMRFAAPVTRAQRPSSVFSGSEPVTVAARDSPGVLRLRLHYRHANAFAAELAGNDAHVVLELGAGSGALAAELLDAWPLQTRDVEYWILEPSADLRERQQRTLARFAPRVRWLDRLPATPFKGVIVANE